ncbi:MAG: HD domain-containing protein [Armatimonadia bacterium]
MGLLRNIRKGFLFLRPEQGLSPADLAPLGEYLSPEERSLFLEMDEPDQRHSLRVAEFCAQSLEAYPQVPRELMMKAALLHDVGKVGGQLGLVFRTLWVFGHRLVPWLLEAVARRSEHARPGTARHKMYIQMYHARVGVQKLKQIGTEPRVLEYILYTEEPRRPEDSLEKRIIMAADGDHVFSGPPSA